ncbi:MAG: gamma-glutamyl-gamma-aminobutyrate hydrolase family protein, partial [Oscillibacter sp.]|nr:gamma-glutamyl-gamma-aminobutyrate hydrolase family protein [Oscillibacter sp.]
MLPGYMRGIESAGGLPLMLPLTEDGDALAQLADLCDGFLFTGGQDVSPSLYGESILPA